MDDAAPSEIGIARKRKRTPPASSSATLSMAESDVISSPQRKKSAPSKEEMSLPERKDPEQEPHPSSFRLFDLPDELWVKIGQMAVDEDIRWRLNMRNLIAYACLPGPTGPYAGVLYPDITQSCRRLRKELIPYYYKSLPSFCIELDNGFITGALGSWLKATDPKYRSFLTRYTVTGLVKKEALVTETGGVCWCGVGYSDDCGELGEEIDACPDSDFAFTEWVRDKLPVDFDVVSRRLEGKGEMQTYVDTIAFK